LVQIHLGIHRGVAVAAAAPLIHERVPSLLEDFFWDTTDLSEKLRTDGFEALLQPIHSEIYGFEDLPRCMAEMYNNTQTGIPIVRVAEDMPDAVAKLIG
jgi:hypothetical protein